MLNNGLLLVMLVLSLRRSLCPERKEIGSAWGKETDRYFCPCWLGRRVRAVMSVVCGEDKNMVKGVAVQFLHPAVQAHGFLITEMTQG
jgi:hypothetical protein